jgi:hypothetical protein
LIPVPKGSIPSPAANLLLYNHETLEAQRMAQHYRPNFVLKILLATLLIVMAFVGSAAAQDDWTEPSPPFRITGNLYYVGSKGLANYLRLPEVCDSKGTGLSIGVGKTVKRCGSGVDCGTPIEVYGDAFR